MGLTDEMTMITEATFDEQMRRSMERLEEMLHRGERVVEWDIHEALHLLSRIVGLRQDLRRMESMLYGNFEAYRRHYNSSSDPKVKLSSHGELP